MDKSELKKKLGKLRKTSAKIKNSDGSVFVGMTKKVGDKLIPHGLGFTRWPTNHSYDGQFKNGKFDGFGIYKSPGLWEYSGLWKNNFMCGYGEKKEYTGKVYKGQFKNSKYHGKGTLIEPNFYRFEGNFKNDNANGKGKVTFLKNSENHEKGEVREGSYKNGKWHGKFKITFPDGEVIYANFNMGNYIEK